MKLQTLKNKIIKQHDKTVKKLHNVKGEDDDAFTSEQLIGEISGYKWVIYFIDKLMTVQNKGNVD